MDRDQAVATWVFVLLTAVRNRLGLSVAEFVPDALRRGLIPFLFDNYELLHYYDNDYIVDDVLRYVAEQENSGVVAGIA